MGYEAMEHGGWRMGHGMYCRREYPTMRIGPKVSSCITGESKVSFNTVGATNRSSMSKSPPTMTSPPWVLKISLITCDPSTKTQTRKPYSSDLSINHAAGS